MDYDRLREVVLSKGVQRRLLTAHVYVHEVLKGALHLREVLVPDHDGELLLVDQLLQGEQVLLVVLAH